MGAAMMGDMFPMSASNASDPVRARSVQEELAYVLGGFGERFAAWEGKRIVIHGTREYAAAIIAAFDERFHFEAVGISDAEFEALPLSYVPITFQGKGLLSSKQIIARKPDLVILTERVRYAEEVYQELADGCREAGIALFDMYGLDWLSMREEIDATPPQTFRGWLAVTAPYDVVVFELPGTVMMDPTMSSTGPLIPRPLMSRLVNRLNSA
ncbi:MAG: hypothetical protein IJH87_02710, partial [Atopobiaceae bacterium]|nr:hypothetical protein [Atopobiaceae bacterium]